MFTWSGNLVTKALEIQSLLLDSILKVHVFIYFILLADNVVLEGGFSVVLLLYYRW